MNSLFSQRSENHWIQTPAYNRIASADRREGSFYGARRAALVAGLTFRSAWTPCSRPRGVYCQSCWFGVCGEPTITQRPCSRQEEWTWRDRIIAPASGGVVLRLKSPPPPAVHNHGELEVWTYVLVRAATTRRPLLKSYEGRYNVPERGTSRRWQAQGCLLR